MTRKSKWQPLLQSFARGSRLLQLYITSHRQITSRHAGTTKPTSLRLHPSRTSARPSFESDTYLLSLPPSTGRLPISIPSSLLRFPTNSHATQWIQEDSLDVRSLPITHLPMMISTIITGGTAMYVHPVGITLCLWTWKRKAAFGKLRLTCTVLADCLRN